MVATYRKKIMLSVVCVTGVYLREIIDMVLVGQMYGLVKNFNVGIFSNIICLYLRDIS